MGGRPWEEDERIEIYKVRHGWGWCRGKDLHAYILHQQYIPYGEFGKILAHFDVFGRRCLLFRFFFWASAGLIGNGG